MLLILFLIEVTLKLFYPFSLAHNHRTWPILVMHSGFPTSHALLLLDSPIVS